MAYIGAEPLPGQNREVDDISSSFNGSTTAFTLQVSGVNVSPETANNILVNIGGVIQNPGTDYTIAASTITFTTAPASGLSFFAIILGAGINTATVADDTIGASKLIDTAVTAGSYTTADITVDAQGRITAAASGSISNAEIANNAVTTAKIADQAVDLTKLPHGTSSNDGKFLRANNGADPSFETVTSTTINSNANNRVITGSDTANTLEAESTLTFDGNNLNLVPSSGEGRILVIGGEGEDARLTLSADDGDDHIDQYNIEARASDNSFRIDQFSGGSRVDRLSIDTEASGGNVTIHTGNLVIGTSGKGIDFSATSDGSGSSNRSELLADFETGTFSLGGPVIGGGSFTATVGRYTRIGNICHVFVVADSFSTSGQNHDLQLSGLPFASSSSNASHAIVSTNAPSFSNGLKANIPSSNTIMAIRSQWADDGIKSQVFNGYGIAFNATYIVG